MTKNSTG